MSTKLDSNDKALVKIDVARKALAEAKSLPDVKRIRDQASTVEHYMKRQRYSLEAIADASELKLRAERRLGEMLAAIPERRGGKSNSHGGSSNPLPDGITWNQSSHWKAVAAVPDAAFEEHIATIREKDVEPLTTAGAIRLSKTLAREERQVTPRGEIPAVTDRYRLINSDVAALGAELVAESVDCIITDPPYPKEFLHLYDHLGALAAHVLRPGGSCLAMVGQSHLPQVIAALAAHLNYQWTLAYLTPGQSTQVFGRHIKSCWKPVLWLVKGKYAGEHVEDLVRSDRKSKEFHVWGQSESGMGDLIEKFTYKGQTILDPFIGGGATAVAGVLLERFVIGADIDASCIQSSALRLAAVAAA